MKQFDTWLPMDKNYQQLPQSWGRQPPTTSPIFWSFEIIIFLKCWICKIRIMTTLKKKKIRKIDFFFLLLPVFPPSHASPGSSRRRADTLQPINTWKSAALFLRLMLSMLIDNSVNSSTLSMSSAAFVLMIHLKTYIILNVIIFIQNNKPLKLNSQMNWCSI